jgi:hypothetical protein
MVADDFQDPEELLAQYGHLLNQIEMAKTFSPKLLEMMSSLLSDTKRETLLKVLYGETFTSFSSASDRVARYPLDEIGEFLIKLYTATEEMYGCTSTEP